MLKFSLGGFHLSRWIVTASNTVNIFAVIGRKAPYSGGGKGAGLRSSYTTSYLHFNNMGPKRKSKSIVTSSTNAINANHLDLASNPNLLPKRQTRSNPTRPASARKTTRQPCRRGRVDTNLDHDMNIVDGQETLRASPDDGENAGAFHVKRANERSGPSKRTDGRESVSYEESDSSLLELEEPITSPPKKIKKSPLKSSIAAKKALDELKVFKAEQAAKRAAEALVKKEADDGTFKPDSDGDYAALEDIDTARKEAQRPPPVNSDYLPLPWKGRLGYVSPRQKILGIALFSNY